VGLVSRLTNRLGDLDERLTDDARELGSAKANAEQARAMIGWPFDQMPRLMALRNRQAEITETFTPKPAPETDAEPGSTKASNSEAEIRAEGPNSSDHEMANPRPTAFPNSIGDALVTARASDTLLTPTTAARRPCLPPISVGSPDPYSWSHCR
jgi:hypothetical protein